MDYTKPQIVLCEPLVNVVQSGVKGIFPVVESASPDSRATNGAYEADE